MIYRFASPFPILSGRPRGRVAISIYAAAAFTLALGGCGGKNQDAEMQARLEKLEKKVDAADKRSHQAISLAMQPGSGAQASFGEVPEFNDSPVETTPEEFSSGEDQDGIPPAPALGPEG